MSMTEAEVVPLRWGSLGLKALARVIRRVAVREFNAQLINACARADANLLLVFKGMFVEARSLRTLRQRGICCVCFYPDVSFTAHGPYLEEALAEYDWVFTTKTFGLEDLRQRLGVTRASVLRHAFDPEIHREWAIHEREQSRLGADVSFIGTWSPKKEALLTAVAEELSEHRLKVFGAQWEAAARRGPLRRAIAGYGVTGPAYAAAIAAAKVNLGLLSEQRPGASGGDAITSRTFHIPAAGGFLLHERTDELGEVLEEGVECEAFEGEAELIEKIEAALADEGKRAAIAERGMARVWAGHSWDHRIREMLAKLAEVDLHPGGRSDRATRSESGYQR